MGLAALSGLLLTASFPKFNHGVLAWIAFVPLLSAIKGGPARLGFRLGAIAGIVHYSTLLYWILEVTKTYGNLPLPLCAVILLLLVGYLALYPALFCMAINALWRRWSFSVWLGPLLWSALEFVRASVLSGFPWENLGYSQHNWLRLIQISDTVGVYGLSALIVAANFSFFIFLDGLLVKRIAAWKPIFVIAILCGGILGYGTWRISVVDQAIAAARQIKVSLVQGNIDQSQKWLQSFQRETINRYARLSMTATPAKPDIVVWPETSLPFYFSFDPVLTGEVVNLVRECGTHFLVGSPSFQEDRQQEPQQIIRYFNSAYLLSPSGSTLGKYDKVHLVPYGEYVPFRRWFPFLGKIVEAVGDFESGKKGEVLSFEKNGKSYKLGVLICYEVIFPELARSAVRHGADILVSMTNDAWFGNSSAPYQHVSMALFRAIETRRTLARAANTGVTTFIDPVGRRCEETRLFEEAVLTRRLPVMSGNSFYTQHGDLFAIACVAISIGALAAAGWQMRTRRKA